VDEGWWGGPLGSPAAGSSMTHGQTGAGERANIKGSAMAYPDDKSMAKMGGNVHFPVMQTAYTLIYGFLGPNGADKTTTLRMLLGLVRPTSGTGKVLGKPLGAAKGLTRVGALVESPTFYPYLSGCTRPRCARRRLCLAQYPTRSQA